MRSVHSVWGVLVGIWLVASVEIAAQSRGVPDFRRRLRALQIDGPLCQNLGPLGTWPRGSRVVVLGEATHGSAEFARLKRRSIECLVQTGGVTTVAIEAPYATWVPIDRWVRGGTGSIDSLLTAQGFWTWNTTEMKLLLTALRAWNVGAGRQRVVRIVGVDPKFADRSLNAVLPELAQRAPTAHGRFATVKPGIPATRDQFMAWLKLSPAAQDSLIAPLASLPTVIDSIARTDKSTHDTIWQALRRHGRVLAHSEAMQREDRINWADRDVGTEITLYIRAAGSLDTALAAVRTASPAQARTLAADLAPVAGSYLTLWRDYTTRWTDAQRATLRRAANALVAALPSQASDTIVARRQRMAATDVRDMIATFDRYLGRPAPPRAARDTAMADLVALAVSEDGPAARVVVWAHDYHASRIPISFFESTTMTGALERRLPGRVRSVGFAFGSGTFLAEFYPLPGEPLPAGVRPGAVRQFRVAPGTAAAAESRLAQLASGVYALDLRQLRTGWFASERMYQRYGSGYNDAWFAQSRLGSRAPASFDWLVYIPQVTTATLLR